MRAHLNKQEPSIEKRKGAFDVIIIIINIIKIS